MKLCLIHWDRNQHATYKGMDRYDMLSDIWKSDLTDKIKPFLPSNSRVDTAVWMHYVDAK